MIDEQLLQSARLIRQKFIQLSNELTKYKVDIEKLVAFLQEKVRVLSTETTNRVKSMKDKSELSDVTKTIIKEMEEVELEEKKLQKRVSKINDELEKLQKEESFLYATIKQRYPTLTDEEIISQVHRHL
jgi:hypothetical protein